MLDRLAVGDVLGAGALLPERVEARADRAAAPRSARAAARRPGSGRRRGAGRRPSPPPSARPPRRGARSATARRRSGGAGCCRGGRRAARSPSAFIAITSQAASTTSTGTSPRRSSTRWMLGVIWRSIAPAPGGAWPATRNRCARSSSLNRSARASGASTLGDGALAGPARGGRDSRPRARRAPRPPRGAARARGGGSRWSARVGGAEPVAPGAQAAARARPSLIGWH